MTLPRFFCDISLEIGNTVQLPNDVANHAGRSLRLRDGDEICIFNGKGGSYRGELVFISGKASFLVKSYDSNDLESPITLALAQSLATSDKMDFIIEKAVELGVQDFYPIDANRSVLKLSGDRLTKKMHHWQSIIISASQQCGRNLLMNLHPIMNVESFLKYKKRPSNILIADPSAKIDIKEACSKLTTTAIMIGPEGGWSSDEIDLVLNYKPIQDTQADNIKNQYIAAISLGERVLRTETAGLFAISTYAAIASIQSPQ